jgi:hypothetical protein
VSRSRSAESAARCRHTRIATPTATVGIRSRRAVNRAGTAGVVFGKAAVTMIAAVNTVSSTIRRNLL